MEKNQIIIGRGGSGYWVDLKLQTQSDVSREHVRLRRDESSGKVFIKDLSTTGTTVNGETIQASIETIDGEKQDRDVWVSLPSKARIGLAGTIFLDFEAL